MIKGRGIDAPRLRDSERERRQEKMRQQLKGKSVTFKPNSLDVLLKREDVDRQNDEVSLTKDIIRFQTSHESSSKDSALGNDGFKKDELVLSDSEAGTAKLTLALSRQVKFR